MEPVLGHALLQCSFIKTPNIQDSLSSTAFGDIGKTIYRAADRELFQRFVLEYKRHE